MKDFNIKKENITDNLRKFQKIPIMKILKFIAFLFIIGFFYHVITTPTDNTVKKTVAKPVPAPIKSVQEDTKGYNSGFTDLKEKKRTFGRREESKSVDSKYKEFVTAIVEKAVKKKKEFYSSRLPKSAVEAITYESDLLYRIYDKHAETYVNRLSDAYINWGLLNEYEEKGYLSEEIIDSIYNKIVIP